MLFARAAIAPARSFTVHGEGLFLVESTLIVNCESANSRRFKQGGETAEVCRLLCLPATPALLWTALYPNRSADIPEHELSVVL